MRCMPLPMAYFATLFNVRKNGVSTPATPSMAVYSEAMNNFTKAATAFMDHVHLLIEAALSRSAGVIRC